MFLPIISLRGGDLLLSWKCQVKTVGIFWFYQLKEGPKGGKHMNYLSMIDRLGRSDYF